MGIRVSIYRAEFYPGRTELNAFGEVEDLTIVNAEGPFEPTDDAPAALVEKGPLGSIRIVPAVKAGDIWVEDVRPDLIGPMAGGTYAATSDSRFRELAEKLLGHRFYGALAVHDRYEDQATYDALSR